jgi:glycosyltransferase involved in cell wall biosynthesis
MVKILSVTWDIFSIDDDKYEVKRNGGAIMIADTCEYIGRKVDSYLFIGAVRTKKNKVGNINICDNTKYLPDSRTKNNIADWQKGLINGVRDAIESIEPTCVLIQGTGEFSYNVAILCKELHVDNYFICHLYIGKNLKYSNACLDLGCNDKIANIDNQKIIFVGNGQKNQFLRDNPGFNKDNIFVVVNGTKKEGRIVSNNMFNKYKEQGKKVLICSGSLQPRKNQIQLVRALSLVKENIRNNMKLLLVGANIKGYDFIQQIEDEIKRSGIESIVEYLGTVERDRMDEIYSIGDGLIMPSLIEGLSLVALEAISYGMPVIMFSDNETAADINDTKATILVDEHSDEALAHGIEKWFAMQWDTDYIREYSKFFTLERVANDYLKIITEEKF